MATGPVIDVACLGPSHFTASPRIVAAVLVTKRLSGGLEAFFLLKVRPIPCSHFFYLRHNTPRATISQGVCSHLQARLSTFAGRKGRTDLAILQGGIDTAGMGSRQQCFEEDMKWN